MSDSSRPLKIKNFGKDRSFSSVSELKGVLSSEYRGDHVSLVYPTRPHGLLRTVYVSVDQAGDIRETYGEQAIVDFQKISETLL
jgi:hypothetical protein